MSLYALMLILLNMQQPAPTQSAPSAWPYKCDRTTTTI